MKRRSRGFFLVLALFMVTFISVMALAFLGEGQLNYRTSLTVTRELQARWLAHSGIEDARLKLQKDPDFPPPMGDEGTHYSYAEQVTDLDGKLVGSYEVTVDQSYALAPYYLVVLECSGRLARYDVHTRIRAELDVSPTDRRPAFAADPNPNYYQIVNWNEEGL